MESRRAVECALRLLGQEGARKDHALAILHRDGEKILKIYLRRRGIPETDAEEMIQNIFLRICQNRQKLTFDSSVNWYAYLYASARNACNDRKASLTEELRVEPPDLASSALELALSKCERDQVTTLADRAWLGVAPKDCIPMCLAAQFIYLDGKNLQNVLELVARSSASEKPRTTQQLLEWISNDWVLRKTAFNALYATPDDLTAILLGCQSVSELDRLISITASDTQVQEFPESWNLQDVQYILLRFRHGLPTQKAVARLRPPLCSERAASINAKCAGLFPFVSVMSSYWERLEGNPARDSALKRNALWKRLVFEYHVFQELTQDDILERVSPPAAITGYTLRNINTWIAGRLANDLMKHAVAEER